MKSLVIIFSLLFTTPLMAVTLPTSSSVVSGGGPSTALSSQSSVPLANIDSAGFVKLCGGVNSATQNAFYGLYSQASPATSTFYTVPSGKSFYAVRIDQAYGSSANATFQLLTGTSIMAENATNAPGGAVYYGNSANCYSSGYTNATVASYNHDGIGLTFPQNVIPVFKACQSTFSYQICILGVVK